MPPQDVEEKASELTGMISSDDEHIVALALVAGVKVLVSYPEGDRDLFTDFKSRDLVQGKVYKSIYKKAERTSTD